MVSFKQFTASFLRELKRRDFGDPPGSLPIDDEVARSPGAKELKDSGALGAISTIGFRRSVHSVLRRYEHQLQMRDEVESFAGRASKFISRFRFAQKTLKSIQRKIQTLDGQLESYLSWDLRERLYRAIKELETFEDQIFISERELASTMHKSKREAHDRKVPVSLKYQLSPWMQFPPYSYDLDSLSKKAPQQWLIEEIDSVLLHKFNGNGVHVSTITRYRIIAAICKAAKFDAVDPLAIKQHLLQKKKRTGKTTSARKKRSS